MANDLPPCTATGMVAQYLPPGPARDELLGLVRLGLKFRQRHGTGKKPGPIARLVLECARRAGEPHTFDAVLVELSLAARRRAFLGDRSMIVLDVSREDEFVTVDVPGRAPRDIPFATIRNHLTQAKKRLRAEIPAKRQTGKTTV